MFDKVINLELPHPLVRNEEIIPKEEYKSKMIQKINEVPQVDALEGVITRDQVIKRINPKFQIWINLKRIFKGLDTISYDKNTYVEIYLQELKSQHISL